MLKELYSLLMQIWSLRRGLAMVELVDEGLLLCVPESWPEDDLLREFAR
jgi:hypothetical protein